MATNRKRFGRIGAVAGCGFEYAHLFRTNTEHRVQWNDLQCDHLPSLGPNVRNQWRNRQRNGERRNNELFIRHRYRCDRGQQRQRRASHSGDELITNGDFTTNLSGWTTSGSVAAASGRASFGLSNLVGPHSISQTIATVAGQTYQLSFDYLDGSSTRNQSLVASVNGIGNLLTTPQIVTDVASTVSGARYTFTFVADSSTATITLTDTSDQSGLSHGTTDVDGLVDNVSVRQLAGQMGTLNYTENAGPVAIHSTLSLSDFDSTNLVGATIQFASGFNASQDLLAFTNQLGITGNYNSTAGVLTLSGSASVADYQTALRSITYANSSESPTGSRTLSFTVMMAP